MRLEKYIAPEKPRKNWGKRIAIVLGILLGLSFLFATTTVAYGATSIDGLAEVLRTGLQGLEAFFEWLIEVLKIIL